MDWIGDYKEVWLWVAGASGVFFLASILVIPVLIVRMRAEYFVLPEEHPHPESLAARRPAVRWAGLILKNVAGVLLILAGIAMLVLPGQGLLSILLGVMLTSFPGKRRLELRIFRLRGVRRAVDGLRRRFHKPPLVLPGEPAS